MLPFRCASLKALYGRFRQHAGAVQGANATAAYRKSSSINPNFLSYYFRVGSSIYPNKPVQLMNGTICGTGSEGFAELLKSFHVLSASIGNSAIPYTSYNVAAAASRGFVAAAVPGSALTVQGTHNNAFAIGLELESFSNRGYTILSGGIQFYQVFNSQF